MKSKGWVSHRKRSKSEQCTANKPWQKSTGPRTAKGKSVTSQNAYKHGQYDADIMALCHALFQQSRYLQKRIDMSLDKY